VSDETGELGEGEVGVALCVVFHSQAVACEGVGRVGGKDFGEGGDLVHVLMVRCGEGCWQVSEGFTRICIDDTDSGTVKSKCQKQVLPLRGRMTTLLAMAGGDLDLMYE
jgi:hypothetical protein